MATHVDDTLDLRKQIARIDQMRASTENALIDIQKTRADIDKVRIEAELMPRSVIFQAMLAAAALLGAGAALAKLFLP